MFKKLIQYQCTIDQVHSTVSHSKISFVKMSFRLRHFAAECLGSFESKQGENQQVPAKKSPFDRLHQMTRLSDDVKKWKLWTG